METVKECIDHILTEFKDVDSFELEIETITADKEWEKDHDMFAAILTILRNPETFTDPIIFSQVVLAINGVPPDFMEFEFSTPEMVSLFFATCDYLETKVNGFKSQELDDDIKSYIAVCCAEDALYYLKNGLEVCQDTLREVLTDVYNVQLNDDDLTECDKLWKEYFNFPTEGVPEDNPELIQVKRNFVIRDYIKEIYN